jgi:hypothetical protein
LQESWPDVIGTLPGCYRIAGRMSQDWWPDVIGLLAG